MGEIFAILSMTLFSVANVTINRGYDGRSRSQGAFLSIVMTSGLSALIWLTVGVYDGFPAISATAVAWFALAGVLTVMIGRVFLYASIQSVGAIRGSAIKRLNPVFSVLLGVLILGESLSAGGVAGMTLIFSSFGVLVWSSLAAAREPDRELSRTNAFSALSKLGYLFGPVSALAYATGYVVRKQGLTVMPDAVFGTMVGATAGTAAFLATALVSERYRSDVVSAFTSFNPWLIVAGFTSTFGQICYFVALKYATVSKIALITSMEVFLTMLLTWIAFRGVVVITRDVVTAALLGVIGTVLIILF